MNIGLFTDTYFPQVSGVSTSVRTLKQALEKAGHKVLVFTTTDPSAKGENNVVRMPSIPFVSFKDRRIAIGGFRQAYNIAKKEQLDLIHTHTEFSIGLVGARIAKLLHIPHIHTYHTMYENYTHYVLNGHLIKPRHVRYLTRKFCEQADGIIVPSQLTYDTLDSYHIHQPLYICPTGVEIPPYAESNRAAIRKELGLHEDDYILLSLSRLSEEKSIDQLIAGFPQIKKQLPFAKLVIAGDGPAKASLEKQARESGCPDIYFIGEIPHTLTHLYYQMADVYVNASESESQGLTFLEALVNFLPIIAKDNPYLKGILSYSPCLGRLYQGLDDFSSVVVDFYKYCNRDVFAGIDREMLKPLSAEVFGEHVFRFYEKITALHEEEADEESIDHAWLTQLKSLFEKEKDK